MGYLSVLIADDAKFKGIIYHLEVNLQNSYSECWKPNSLQKEDRILAGQSWLLEHHV